MCARRFCQFRVTSSAPNVRMRTWPYVWNGINRLSLLLFGTFKRHCQSLLGPVPR